MFEVKYICGPCIDEIYLKKYINENGIFGKCSYCGKKTRVQLFDKILDLIHDGVYFVFDNPVNGLGFIDGEYVKGNGPIYDSEDMLSDIGLGDSKAFKDILSSLPDDEWCNKVFYGMDESEESIYTWEYFVEQVKYKTRFFFIREKTDIKRNVRFNEPFDILEELAASCNRLDLIDILKKGSIIFRGRKNSDSAVYKTAKDLGTPPAEDCLYSNRMSPAGIPMFYGSLTPQTCLAEIGNEIVSYTIGKWKIKKDLRILNLTKYFKFNTKEHLYFYPNFPSIFDSSRREYRSDYKFILRFASDLSKKLSKKGKENIDYVPTQIVTEFLRKFGHFPEKIDGICFYSSKDGGINYTLFIEQHECLNTDNQKIELISFKELRIET